MADENQDKAEAAAEKAYATAAEAVPPVTGDVADVVVPSVIEPSVSAVAFPPKGKRKPAAVAAPSAPVVELAPAEPEPIAEPVVTESIAAFSIDAPTPEIAPVKITKQKLPKVAAKPIKRKLAAGMPVPPRAAAGKPVIAEPTVAFKPAVATKAPIARQTPVAAAAVKPQFEAPAKPLPLTQIKDKTMDMTSKFTDGLKGVVSDAQAKAKEAFEKSSAIFSEYNEFAKGNVEATVESGKIFASGLQGMGTSLVAEGKSAFETMTTDFKDLSAVKTPADFFKLQSDLFRRNFDTAVAYGSKNSEAMLKLANEVMAPISGRVSLAVDKVRKAA
jgi:hypothetical protein